jgi:hypothetical protein
MLYYTLILILCIIPNPDIATFAGSSPPARSAAEVADAQTPSDNDNRLVQMAFKDFDSKRFDAVGAHIYTMLLSFYRIYIYLIVFLSIPLSYH